MTIFLMNILLALAWLGLTGAFTPANFLLGFLIALVLLWFLQRRSHPSRYFDKLQQAMRFTLFVAWELLASNFRVAFDVVTPRHRMRPGVLAIPLDARTDTEITLLANLITLTPGTLSMDVSTDRRVLYVHVMYIDDADRQRRSIKHGFERRILELLR